MTGDAPRRGRPSIQFDFSRYWANRIYRDRSAAVEKRNGRPRLVTLAKSLGADGKIARHQVAIEILQLTADVLQKRASGAGKAISRKKALLGALMDEFRYRGLLVSDARAVLYRVVRLDQMRRSDRR